ncbi:MAG: hypothetical protein AB7Q17_08170 [Phycisphaerae bacterium]
MLHSRRRETRLLEEQAQRARAGVAEALGDLRRELHAWAAPRALLRRHPVGVCVGAGVLAWFAAAGLRGGAMQRRGGAWLGSAWRGVRDAIVGSLLTRAAWSVFGPGAPRGFSAQCDGGEAPPVQGED